MDTVDRTGQVISACGCPSALQDDTPREGCLGDQSFSKRVFLTLLKICCVHRARGRVYLPSWPISAFFKLDLGSLLYRINP